MLLSSRLLRSTVLCFFAILAGACISQNPAFAQNTSQFVQPKVLPAGGRVASLVTGHFEDQAGPPDILYINAAVVSGTTSQVTARELLADQSFANLAQNQITFQNVASVSVALGDFDGDGHTDFAFALSPSVAGGDDLCVYYGTGLGATPAAAYSPLSAKSDCTGFPIQGSAPPNFAYIAAAPFQTGQMPQLIVEDSANDTLYILANSGAVGVGGALPGFSVKSLIAIPAADGAGPIYTGDFNHDGNTDFIVNGQNGRSASVYLGNGDGTFQAPVLYTFDHNVHSMLLQDMDGDGIADMVVEGDGGGIEIFKGNTDGSFAQTSEGGTGPGLDDFSGNGGHLVGIAKLGVDAKLDILIATPIGLNVLQSQDNLTYKLKGIYNVGPGRSSFALGDFDGDGNLDLAVDSPEGVAIVQGNSDGTFQTSLAYPILAGGGGGIVARTPTGREVLSFRDDAGTAHSVPANRSTDPMQLDALPALSGWPADVSLMPGTMLLTDLDGDGDRDIIVPFYNAGSNSGAAAAQLYIWYGNRDGSFAQPQIVTLGRNDSIAAVADMNKDGLPDIILSDGELVSILYNQGSRGFSSSFVGSLRAGIGRSFVNTGGSFASEQHLLAGQAIQSISIADVNGDGWPDLLVTNGGTAATATSNPAGVTVLLHSQATVEPRALVATTTTLALCIGGSAPNCPVNGTPTGLTIVPSLTMIYGQIFNGTEAVSSSDGSTLTGSLDFYQDGVLLCQLAASGTGTCPPSVGMGTTAGTHVFQSTYTGDATHASSSSNIVTIAVQQDTSAATLSSSGSPSIQGQPVTFTATLTGNIVNPTGTGLGTVTFMDGNTAIGTGAVNSSGIATLTTSALPVGTDAITAVYSGSLNFAATTSSPALNQIVLPLTTTTTTLTSSINPSNVGQSVTFTATVASAGGTPIPTGTVTFYNGTAVLGSGTLNSSGVATFSTSFPLAGTYSITASASGDALTAASTSAVLMQVVNVVNPVDFTITVTPSAITVGVGGSAALLVTVTTISGFTQSVNLSCSSLPYEVACAFANATIPASGGQTLLLLSAMAPHNCGSSQPYFQGGNSPGPKLLPLAAPVLAGLLAIFVPGRRRWLRALVAMVAIAGAMQIAGCSNCTDLGTRPGTYTIQVSGTASGTSEIHSQPVTVNVAL